MRWLPLRLLYLLNLVLLLDSLFLVLLVLLFAALLLLRCFRLPLHFEQPVLINLFVIDDEELLRVLRLLVNHRHEQLFLNFKHFIDLADPSVHLSDVLDDGGFLVLQVKDLVVEVDFQFVD
jgi:hypothetical protein